MTTDELKNQASVLLRFGIDRLLETGNLSQMFEIHTIGGPVEVIAVEGAITNDPRAKDDLAETIRARIAQGRVEAVFMLSDTYWAEPDAKIFGIIKKLGMSVREAGDMGLVKVHEGVAVMAECPIGYWQFVQEYSRANDGSIELCGEPKEMPGGARAVGRFAGYWPAPQGVQ